MGEAQIGAVGVPGQFPPSSSARTEI